MRRAISLILVVITLIACSGCFFWGVEDDRRGHYDRDRGGHDDRRDHDDRGDHDRGGHDEHR